MLGWGLVEGPGKVCAAPYLVVRGRLAPGPETEQGLERGHGLPAPIVAEDKPEADRGSRRDRFRSAIAGDSQWRGLPKAAPSSRLCGDRFAGAEGEAHAEIQLPATPRSS